MRPLPQSSSRFPAYRSRALPANFWSNRCAQGEVPRMELGRPTDGLFHSMSRNLRCPLWVRSGHRSPLKRCPLYPQKLTLELSREMSALCQKRTHALQQSTSAAIRNLIAGQGLPFETLCIASCLTAGLVVCGGLAVGHGVFERDPGDLERLQECRCRVAEHLVGVSAAG